MQRPSLRNAVPTALLSRTPPTLVLALALLLVATATSADVITFEELPASNDPAAALGDEYLLEWGVLFGGGDGAVWNGLSDGDPGGWGLEGTNGPSFLGMDGPGFAMEMGFDVVVQDFALDVAMPTGSLGLGVVLTGFRDGVAVEQITTAFAPAGQWKSVALTADVDAVRVAELLGVGEFAVDNLRWVGPERPDPEPQPEPVPQVHPARLDVMPGSHRNRVKVPGHGHIVVVLFGDPELDVMDVDEESLVFGPEGAPNVMHRYWRHGRLAHDFDRDGHLDLVTLFRASKAGITEDDEQACMLGATQAGMEFEGCDHVTPVVRKKHRWWRRGHGHDDGDSDSGRRHRR